MRRLWPLLLVACSSPAEAPPTPVDAGRDTGAVEDEDAGIDAALACTPATSCFPYNPAGPGKGISTCATGHLYGCYGARCPTGEVGACTVAYADGIDNYAEACCEELACVRAERPGDGQCAEAFDGGAFEAWTCPSDAKPKGTCKPLFSGALLYCCAK